jgi:putative transposase
VSRIDIEVAIKYVTNQKEHHKKIGFKEEFLAILDRAGMEYDERYLWD